MPQSQAVVLIDHHGAQLQHLDDGRGESIVTILANTAAASDPSTISSVTSAARLKRAPRFSSSGHMPGRPTSVVTSASIASPG
jgi:hypothetical protein